MVLEKSRQLSPAKKAWITRKIKSGKSKYQVAKELNINRDTIYRIAKDLPSKPCGWPGLRGKTLELLQKILVDGYAVYSDNCTNRRYMTLKKYFPTICRVKMYGKNIFFLEDKADVAARAFIGNIRRKIISYQELKQITEVFGTNFCKREKDLFLGKID
jgi:hypothetical protein